MNKTISKIGTKKYNTNKKERKDELGQFAPILQYT